MKSKRTHTTLGIILVALLCTACTNPDETRVFLKTDNYCKKDTTQKRVDFILQCIANANPKSDEEPEDWIRECQWMAEDTFCDKAVFEVTERYGDSSRCHWCEVSRRPKELLTLQ